MSRIRSFINMGIASLLVLLGFGGCHSSKKLTKAQEFDDLRKAEEAALQEARKRDSLAFAREQQDQKRLREKIEQQKVVYGPAPTPYRDKLTDFDE